MYMRGYYNDLLYLVVFTVYVYDSPSTHNANTVMYIQLKLKQGSDYEYKTL